MANVHGKAAILITSDLEGESYQEFIDRACKSYRFFSTVVRSDLKVNSSLTTLLEAMKPNLVKVVNSRQLPMGRIHSAHPAKIYFFQTTPRSIRPYLKQVGSLFQWIMPNYPEDLCFYRTDQSLAVVANSHEHLAFFFDREMIQPYLEGLEWSEQNYTEKSFTNLLRS